MYSQVGHMKPGPLDTMVWDVLPVLWHVGLYGAGWGSVTDPPAWLTDEASRQLALPVGCISLIAIRSGGVILPHEDGMTTGWRRFHLVVQTNRWCWSFHETGWEQLLLGGIYQMDANKLHGSVNLGATTRWHLIADSK